MAVQQITWANQCAFMRGKGGKRGRMGCHCAQGPAALSERRGPHPSSSFHPAPAAARRAGTSESAEERVRIPGGAEEARRQVRVDPNPSMAPRGRVQMRRIEDRVSRQVRFSKRRTGLFKKAMELNVLCDAEVSILVFSPAGKVYQYSSTSMEDIYDRYQQFAREGRNVNEADQNRNNNQDDSSLDLQWKLREITTWSLQNNVEESDAYELEKLEDLLRNALRDTRSKKIQKFAEQTNGGSTSTAQNCNGANIQEQGKE